ncbi:MAG TPA: YdcF family protein, partial [Acidimicrobiales bacterium]
MNAADTTVALRTGRPPRHASWAVRIVVGALIVAAFLVGGTAFRVWYVARADDRRPADAVIVLGAAQYDGEPSSVFAARLRHAETLYEERLAPRIVTTGGSRAGDAYTEAEAGRRYLIERGVPADAVIAVGEGTD